MVKQQQFYMGHHKYFGPIWLGCLNNNFKYLNNNNTFDTYFCNTKIRISKKLKIEQQYLNTVTKQAFCLSYFWQLECNDSNFSPSQ